MWIEIFANGMERSVYEGNAKENGQTELWATKVKFLTPYTIWTCECYL